MGLDIFLIEMRCALRGLLRSKTFTLVVLASLALGLAAVTTFFTLADRLVLRPLALAEPDRLVNLFSRSESSEAFMQHSFPNYEDYRDRNDFLSGLTACQWVSLSLTEDDRPERLLGQVVTGNFFDVLGVPPLLGRSFTPEEDQTLNTHPVAVLSHGFWQRRFAGEDVLGKSLRLNNTAFTIIGVMPKGFRSRGPIDPTEVWLPLMMHPTVFAYTDYVNRRGWSLFHLIGRLKDGVAIEAANAALGNLAQQMAEEYPEENEGQSLVALSMAESAIVEPNTTASYKQRTRLFALACGLLLLIACTNVINLLLVRARGRRHETALRLALGAQRGPLLVQILSESAFLFLTAAILSLPLAALARDLLLRVRPNFWTDDAIDFSLDLRVFLFALLVAFVCALVSSLLPAWSAMRMAPATVLGGRDGAAGKERVGPSKLLAVVQLALSFIALISAGLFFRSYGQAQNIDPGFDPDRLLTLTWNAMALGQGEPEGRRLAEQVLSRVRTLPGVEKASLTSVQLLNPNDSRRYITFPDRADQEEEILISSSEVAPEYFETLGIQLLKGRGFLASDRQDSVPVAVINQEMEHRFWGDESAIGRRFFLSEEEPVEVVGVTENTRHRAMIEATEPFFYLPLEQVYSAQTTLYVRTPGQPVDLLPVVRKEVQAAVGAIPLINVKTLPELVRSSVSVQRTGLLVMGCFSIIALFLAVMGIYGITADWVSRRRRELGIRAALGAQPKQLIRMILGEAVLMILAGLTIGLAAALATVRLLGSQLYGVTPTDPPTFVIVALCLATVALLASFLPARRAVKSVPARELRQTF